MMAEIIAEIRDCVEIGIGDYIFRISDRTKTARRKDGKPVTEKDLEKIAGLYYNEVWVHSRGFRPGQLLLGEWRRCQNLGCLNAFYARAEKIREDKGRFCSPQCRWQTLRLWYKEFQEFRRWFLRTTANQRSKKAAWLVETTRLRAAKQVFFLSELMRLEKESIKDLLWMISGWVAAKGIVQKFCDNGTVTGRRLRQLWQEPRKVEINSAWMYERPPL
jgi:hypothetical protein